MAAIIHSPTASKPPTDSLARGLKSGKSAIMDFRPSKSLVQGIRRIGGRSGVSRIGQSSRRGRPVISKRY
jgi:hypothetical protein